MKGNTMTTESKPKPVYKKTDRTRSVDKHKHLDIVADGLRANLELVLGRAVTVNVSRSAERRYARALFKVDIGDITIDGKTMEEVLQIAEGVKIVSEMKEAA
jgi:hypothetical protein